MGRCSFFSLGGGIGDVCGGRGSVRLFHSISKSGGFCPKEENGCRKGRVRGGPVVTVLVSWAAS